MYRLAIVFLLVLFSFQAQGQTMTSSKLLEIIEKEADTTAIQGNSVRFLFNETMLICIYDENANRMRIISPIVERGKLGEEELSVYAHPLKELTELQVIDAIQQVYAAALTFGGSYSSTDLVFPGNTNRREQPKDSLVLKKI